MEEAVLCFVIDCFLNCIFSRFFFPLGTFCCSFAQMDGLDYLLNIQAEIEVPISKKKIKRKKNSNSKFSECLMECLNNGKHKHMLKLINEKEFAVKFTNMKSKYWTEKDISLFRDLDDIQGNKKRSKENYAEKCKGRFRANMKKLNDKYIKFRRSEKDPKDKTITRNTYEIIWPKYIAGLRMSSVSSEENYITVENGVLCAVETEAPNVLIQEYTNPNMNFNENGNFALNIESTNVFVPTVDKYENGNNLETSKENGIDFIPDLNNENEYIAVEGNENMNKVLDLDISKENDIDCMPYLNNESGGIKGIEDTNKIFETLEGFEVNDWNAADSSIYEKMMESKDSDKEHDSLKNQDIVMEADENCFEECSNLYLSLCSFKEKLFNFDDSDFDSWLMEQS